MDHKKPLLALALLCAAGLTHAGEKEELLKLRNTTTNLIKQLVKQGILSDKTANEMIKQAEADADQQVAEAKSAAPKEAAAKEAVPADEVRVAYVPDFVKDEIRQQVRSELREEVVGDVMAKAKKEQWGLPNALPEWTKRFKLSGDMRLREQSSFYPTDNVPSSAPDGYLNYQAINDLGGYTPAVNNNALYLNTTDNQTRLRERVRLGIDAQVVDGLVAGIRLTTGNIKNPVSTNQTLGNYGDRYDFRVDRAFLKYDLVDDSKFSWLTLAGGRIANPWFTAGSELVWDEDLSFEGVAATVRHRFSDSDGIASVGSAGPMVFATAGAFPLQESVFTSQNKWLFGGQTGLDWGFANQDNLKVGIGYFDYLNNRAKPNSNPDPINGLANTCNGNSADNNFSKPDFMQFGNSLARICNDNTVKDAVGLMGLASDYKIINVNAAYDFALFSPHHLKLSADYAKNLGFNLNDINSRYDTLGWVSRGGDRNNPQTNAWQVRADLGWQKYDIGGHWSVFTLYKHLERDAVLDAFTDSDFHLGGTNTKGWVVGGNYGLMKNVWLTGRWLSGNIIAGPQYGVDVMQLDVNTHF
ncbi:MAG: putative porin [Methylococcaceae bacterium]